MESFITVLVCFLASAGAGIGTGVAGMSAATIIGPVLSTFLGIPLYDAVGIGLISDVLASAVSAYTYYKSGNVNIRQTLPMLASVVLMTAAGSFVATLVPERSMGDAMQWIMLLLGLRFLIKPIMTTRAQMQEVSPRAHILRSVLGGAGIGFICGFIGAGGGMLMLFVLTILLGYELHIAVGTSVFVMTFTALTGGVSHFIINGLPDLLPMLLCVAFTFLWARLSALVANRLKAPVLNRILGVVLILTGVALIVVNLLGLSAT